MQFRIRLGRYLPFVLIILCASVKTAYTQLRAQYTFSVLTRNYDSILNGTVVPELAYDDSSSIPIPIGFNFVFNNTSYTQVIANSNGWLSFGNINAAATQTTSNQYPAAFDQIGPVLMPLWDKLSGNAGSASYKVEGIAPYRIFVFEWKNWKWNVLSTDPNITFQTRLYESDHTIEYCYRQEAGSFYLQYAVAGIAAGSSDFWLLADVTANPLLVYTTDQTGRTPTITQRPSSSVRYRFERLPACQGTPLDQVVAQAPNTFCSNNPIKLSASQNAVSGISYQWESAPAGTGNFMPIAGAGYVDYIVSGLTAATDFRYTTTCQYSGASAVSDTFSIMLAPANLCYCNGNLGGSNTNGAGIDTVSIINTTLNNASVGIAQGFYTRYPASGGTTVSLEQGFSYTIVIAKGNPSANTGVWIDYNGNGSFNTTEFISFPRGSTSATFTVPANAMIGPTGMRVRTNGGGTVAASSSCTSFSSGETEDYTINIIAQIPCSGAPAGGRVKASVTAACPIGRFDLSLSNYTPGGIIQLQWQSAPAGTGLFTDIAGAVNPTHAITGQGMATDYRCRVTCPTSGLFSFSDTLSMNQKPLIDCYCKPGNPSSCTVFTIEDFVMEAIGKDSILDKATGCFAMGYSDRTMLYPAKDLILGQSYYYTIRSGFYDLTCRIWIDFNDNGLFEGAETVSLIPGTSNFIFTGLVRIPTTANLGTHAMRVRITKSTQVMDPCSSFIPGEVHDYMVNIVPDLPDDAGVRIMLEPDNGSFYCERDTVSILAEINNCGPVPLSGFDVQSFYTGPVSGVVQTAYTGVLSPHTVDTLEIGYFVPSVSGNYTVRSYAVVSGDPRRLNDTAFTQIDVKPLPVVNIGPDTSMCITQLPFILDAGNPGAKYIWKGANTINTNRELQTYDLYAEGRYWVKVTDPYGCIAEDTMTLAIDSLPAVAGIIVDGFGQFYQFGAGLPQRVTDFYWDFGDGVTATGNPANHNYAAPGTYKVQLVAANACGFDTVAFDLVIIPSGIGALAASGKGLAVYPNPATDVLNVNVPKGLSSGSISIVNSLGKVMKTVLLNASFTYAIDISNLAAGSYWVVVASELGLQSIPIQVN